MTMDLLLRLSHVLVALACVLLIAGAGRFVAGKARQPGVIGELSAGLLVTWLLGPDTIHALLPADELSILKVISEVGLALLLSGLTYHLRTASSISGGSATGWVAVGALVPPLAAGALLACWILLTAGDRDDLRGTAPAAALVLMLAVSLAITAVPVLARILTDRAMTDTRPGRLALASAVVIDAVSWLLLTVAIGLASGSLTGFVRSMLVLGGCLLVVIVLRSILRSRWTQVLCREWPVGAALLVGVIVVAMALTVERLGMTVVVGAALAGLAVPATEQWSAAMTRVKRLGLLLAPVFFVVTGLAVLTGASGTTSITLIALALLLGIAGKVAGGYLGARAGDVPRWDSLRVGTLMNTRGLTELIVLQAGYSAGILTAPVFVALVVMALVTTAMTGPALSLIDRTEARRLRIDRR